MEAARSTPRWAPVVAVLALSPLLVSSCKKKSANLAAEPAASAAAPASAAQAVPDKPASEFKNARFALKIEPNGSYKSGQSGQAQIVLTCNAPYHCNDKYPYKFKLKDSPGLKYPATIVQKDAVQLQKHQATMTVGFTPESAGKKTIAGKFLFSLCSADKCLVERRDLTLDVNVD